MRIVYNSYQGRYSDSPRALHQALEADGAGRGSQATHTWLMDPRHAAAFPARTPTVQVGSAESVAALEAADLVIANTHIDEQWTKRPGAVYLQTWHGTPLKRIHRDALTAPTGGMDRLDRDIARWDLLVSPSPASTAILRGAFDFHGEVVQSGYPRNDVLSAPDRADRRARVRAGLHLEETTTAVLYAPTWRDGAVLSPDDPSGMGLDTAALLDELGDDHVLLMRLHYLLPPWLVPADGPRIRNVTSWPQISDLYLAADVLVTDYSSAMFDFAVTGKPMLFYTYDLDHYRDTLRGFYLDFEAEAPGPLVQTWRQLADALRRLPEIRHEYDNRYTAFRDRYTSLEDGHATARVMSVALARLLTAR